MTPEPQRASALPDLFSTADEDYHAPNEFFRLQRLEDGMQAWIRYWQLLGEAGWARGDVH